MAAAELFGALVLTGTHDFSRLFISAGQLQALYEQGADLAVAFEPHHLRAGRAGVRVAGQRAGMGASRGPGTSAALLTSLALPPRLPLVFIFVQRCDGVAFLAARVVSAGEQAATRPAAREGPTRVTWQGSHLVFPKAVRGYGYQAGRAGQGAADKGRS